MKNNPFFDNPARRGAFLSFAWIASVILVGGLLWLFTRPIRTGALLRAANRNIARTGETRRLLAPAGSAAGLGTWFTLTDESGGAAEGSALVFTLFSGARAAACAAFVDDRGGFEKFIPLGDVQVIDDLPEAVYAVYRERILRARENRR
ncbi:MAG: hypothetical protein LBH35_05800 [Treponema sp.]|jgi:hypothetical protein|nr:hypothetical protein [Treponema sp.]